MDVRTLFEGELTRRGLRFSVDAESNGYVIDAAEGRCLVHLDNLERGVASDGDAGRVPRFVDTILSSLEASDDSISADGLYWCLEPNDYEEPAEIRFPISDCVDRVLVHLSPDGSQITWVSGEMLETLSMDQFLAANRAFENLSRALEEATIECNEIDGVHLGFLSTSLPFKAALLLAPNLREVVGAKLGWPLLAVVPDRDFIYLWDARHSDFVGKVGKVVVREYNQAPYPISTEVYRVSDEGIRAIGAFPTA
ncbi:hypothetical protein [Luteolibacter soli]|uniref:DUF1444 family protein n=1 Tax=Luteolibacter soli TaxID=3135280 RepID=A0ABU9ASZ0_9BACT